jgi:hypothetical protein
MKSTSEKTRPKARTLAPVIREVCLTGSPARRYVHLSPAPEGLGTEDSGLRMRRKTRKAGTG